MKFPGQLMMCPMEKSTVAVTTLHKSIRVADAEVAEFHQPDQQSESLGRQTALSWGFD